MLNSNEVRYAETKQRQKLKELISPTNYLIFFAKDDYSRTDGFIISADCKERYTIETKWYGDEGNKRYSDKFKNYMIDYSKLDELTKKSVEYESTPLLICFFSNELVVWDISRCNWQSTGERRLVNKEGLHYGKEKELAFMAYLNLSDAVYRNKNITPFN